MKIIETKVFEFDELDAKAKQKARDWYRTDLEFDSEPTIEDATLCFSFVGITIKNVYFSGFSSQGDGACFEGSWSAANVQPGKLKEHAPQDTELHRIAAEFERIAALFPNASFTVKHSGRYSHEHCTEFDISFPDSERGEWPTDKFSVYEKFTEDLQKAAKNAMRWIYAKLEEAYDWERADEQVDQAIRSNEYTFTAEGRRFG